MHRNKLFSQLTRIVIVSDEEGLGMPAITEFWGHSIHKLVIDIDIQDDHQVDMGILVSK